MEALLSTLLFVSTAACFVALSTGQATQNPQFTAMYVFGDSLNDPGNNVNFVVTLAKANYWPYGIDLDKGPTGRFCNGKILVDFLAELLGLHILPSYAESVTKGADILSGVNYASAAAGILEDTGFTYGNIIPLSEQINNFRRTLSQLRSQTQEEELSNYLAKALVFFDLGANDYLNNYLVPLLYRSSHIYTPQQFTDLLIQLYTGYISDLHSLGMRKFLLAEVAPIGCIPLLLGHGNAPPGECASSSNEVVQMFNSQLKSLVYRLNSNYPDSVFTVVASYQMFIDLRDNAAAYGIKVKDTSCCPSMCLPSSVPCFNRNEYLFWDYAHTTQAVNQILAYRVYNDTSYCSPFSIQQLAAI